ncbi:hypothetical protein WMY93_030026 [Mugilogobius chulae]|uniref:Ig-like domain-containing protein n=1 Tax=Mugilogobius chulae TaxID=88201 RepID=A0AAW0MR40_9GOBI
MLCVSLLRAGQDGWKSDSPWIPSITVSGDQTETEVVTITCSAVTPCPLAPPKLTWDLHQDSANIKDKNSDRTFTTKITQNITLTEEHDGLMIKCNASYPVSGGGFKMSDNNVTLSVSYAPKNTSAVVSPSGSLSAGQSVTLSCSSRAKPPVQHFTWFRHSSQGPVNVSEGQTYTFNFTEEEQYYCVASNTLRNGYSPVIQLRTEVVSENTVKADVTWIGSYNIVQLCGVLLLCCSLVVFECWFRKIYKKREQILPFGNMFVHVLLNLLLSSGADAQCLTNLKPTTPSPMEALSGSCLFVPCTYKPVNTNQDINPKNSVTGSWSKGSNYGYGRTKFSISGDPSKSYPMNITGNLKIKDCTTMFYDLNQSHQDDYYFRIENNPFTASAVCDPLHITVRDSPWIPSITVSGDQTETEVVTITCSAVTPCPDNPPNITWDLQQGTANIKYKNSDRTFTTKITHSITLTDAHDGLMIKCNASYPVSGGFKMSDSKITLSVSYGPKNTSAVVSPSGSLSAGQSVTLSCSSRAKPPVQHFTWFRHNSQGQSKSLKDRLTHSTSVKKENIIVWPQMNMAMGPHSGLIFFTKCCIYHMLLVESVFLTLMTGAERLSFRQTLTLTTGAEHSPWSPSITVSGDQTETEVVTLTCSAVTPCPLAPPKLTWDLHQDTVSITERNSDGTFTTKITQNITLTEEHDGLMLKCNASYPVSGGGFKMSDSNVTLSVSYGPKNTSAVVSPSGSLSAGQSVTLSCSSRAKPPVQHFTWFRHSSQGPVKVTEGQNYTFNFTQDEEYYCVASNQLLNQFSPIIQLRSKGISYKNNGIKWAITDSITAQESTTRLSRGKADQFQTTSQHPGQWALRLLFDLLENVTLPEHTCVSCDCDESLSLNVTTPNVLEALSGSCLQIPCSFTPKSLLKDNFDATRRVIGVWIKTHHSFRPNPEFVIFNSSKENNPYPMKLTGDLTKKDCTTLFNNLTTKYSDMYYFRIENKPFSATDFCNPLQIKVTDSPWRPSVEVFGELKVTEVVNITCSAVTPCPHKPPELTWDPPQVSPKSSLQQNSDGTFTTSITQTITLTSSHDGHKLTCFVAYPVRGEQYKTAQITITLNVTQRGVFGNCNVLLNVATPNTLKALSGSCLQIPCSFTPKSLSQDNFDATRTVIGVWLKTGTNFGTNPDYVIFNSSHENNPYPMKITGDLTKKNCTTLFSNLTKEYSDQYFFRIENRPFVSTAACEPLQINIIDRDKDGDYNMLSCHSLSTRPPKLTWDLHQDTANITERNSDGTFTTKITQSITLTDAHDGLKIKCNASYPVSGGFKMSDSNVTLSVSSVVSPSGSLSAGQSVTLSCSSRAKPPVQHFTWFRHSSQGPVKVTEGQTYTFNITEDGVYYCVASNTLRNEYSSIIQLRSKAGGSVVTRIDSYNIVKLCGVLLLCCSLVVWLCFGKNIGSSEKMKDCTTEFNDLKSEYTEKYFFRVEDGSFMSTASCSPVDITVRDSPWSPSIEVFGDLTETEVVTITCSAITPCPHKPPKLTLNLQQDSLTHNLRPNSNGTFINSITQTITLTSSHDGHKLTCSAAYPVRGEQDKTAQTTITLNVERIVQNEQTQINTNYCYEDMDVFSVNSVVLSSMLCVFLCIVLSNSCHLDPSISISPVSLEGLSGSCLLIPCEFKKDCTTEFNDLKSEYTEKYFFRVEDGSFMSTASCSPVNITVRDSPWSPSIEVVGNLTETEVVTITCSAVTPCPHNPPKLTLNLQQDSLTHNMQPNSNGTFTTSITQTITLTSSHDGHELTCSAAYPVRGEQDKTAQTTITLNVTRKSGDVMVMWLSAIIVLLIVLIVVFVLIWHFKFRRAHCAAPTVQPRDAAAQEEPAETEDSSCTTKT